MKKIAVENLTAKDIMQKHVVAVGPRDSLRDAMQLMTEHHISGLPVLDGKDHCVGVVSATDIISFEQEQSESGTAGEDASFLDPDTGRWEAIRVVSSLDDLPDVPVRDVMTREVVSVRPTTPIQEVAKKMIDREIHRILVLDDKQYLHGIISTVDFVRLFVN